ncbi:MAG: transcription termination/antitermination factor NusG [Eubacterium sp.]|nr:transcription termination/antitermination factor NusG [Eubacterium sp.]
MAEGKWYVVHTYSGYENKVKTNIEQSIENRKMQDQIFEVLVPTQQVVELKNNVRKVSEKKIFPGYVLVNMIMNDDTWYVVRNTRGVTGFVGPASKPVPLTDREMATLGVRTAEKIEADFAVGDMVSAIGGVWQGTAGEVKRIDENKQTVTITVDMFGRETPVELSFAEVKKM